MSKHQLNIKSRKDSQIKTDWQHTEEVSPAFKRLMLLLLKDRGEKSGVKKQNELSE